MIEANEPTNGTVVKQETPTQITTTMILTDLDNGISRDGIKEKYGLETWMVTQLFQHPTLKGKKAKKIRTLPFAFVDDTLPLNSGDIAVEQTETIDPNQTSIPVQVEDTLDEGPQIIESFDEDFVDNTQLTQL
tara:strand:- start:1055 stop:1453 length:399 start_codon:yes stop_codon:yes gene_type:complete